MRKRLIIVLFCYSVIGCIQPVSAQPDFWTQKNATGSTQTTGDPSTGRYGGICFVIGDKAYIGSGLNLSSGLGYVQDFWEYDAATDTWTRKADIPVKRQHPVSFSIGSKGYFGTGWDGNNFKKDFWEYDPATNSWTQKGDFGGEARHLATGFSIGNKGYMGTGYDGFSKKDFWEYNPTNNTWTQKADFGGGSRYFCTGFSISNKGYVATGYPVIVDIKKDFWEYDPTNNTWTQKSDYGGGKSYSSVGFCIGDKGYVGTGHNGINYKKDFWEYDQATNSWTQKVDFDGGERLGAAGFCVNGKGYIGSGHDLNEIDKNDLWVYTKDPVVTSPPTIISITPASACAGTTITITGTKFNNVTAVSIGGIPVPSFKVVSSTIITAIIGNVATGIVTVNTSNGTATYNGFTLLISSSTIVFNPDTILLNSASSIFLNPTVTGSPSSFQWFPANKLVNPSSLTPQTILIVDSAIFRLTLISQEGCSVSGKVTVVVSKDLYMPNAFTPNNDGLNDLFRIPPGVIMELKELSVYDRSGNRIFITNNITKGWDGTYNGILSVPDIYVYMLKGKKDNKEIFLKGTFMLIR